MKITINLTHRCNLSCRYCYSGRAFKKDMSLATAKKVINFAYEITPQNQKIEFCFFGGEPLLCFSLMKEIMSYIHELEETMRNPIQFSITTNGTLLTKQVLDFFKENNFNLCISLDGPAHLHNLNRIYKDGRGSFKDVMRNLKIAMDQLANVQVNAVYGPDTIDYIRESLSYFTQLGVQVIHLNPNINSSWGEEAFEKIQGTYMEIAEHYIHNYQFGNEIAINLIDSKIIIFLKGGYHRMDKCGMGETEWGFAPSGNIYPCERFIGEDNDSSLCLGNIHTGLDFSLRCSLLKKRGNHNKECISCDLQKYCMNWCGCTNYHMTGHTDLASPILCQSEKSAIEAARYVLVSLKDNDLFLNHFSKYLHEGHHYQ